MHACMHACMHTCIHSYIHTYIHTCIHRRLREASPVYRSPGNLEIGFVSSSFWFHACRACRAWRGKAVRAHVGRCSYRWASRVLGSTCVHVRCGAFGVNILCAGTWVLIELASFSVPRALFHIARSMGFKKTENAAYSICMGFER